MNGRKHPVRRLHGLGRKLSLINMGISGAILVVIASIALGIADRTITQQGARDLGLYVRAVHTMLAQTTGEADAEGVLLRLLERYQVYYKGEQWGHRRMVPRRITGGGRSRAAPHCRRMRSLT
ncbi:hypothetical protein FACS1894184_09960 [Clostridia bacterium]|nr:hypothetical protein FACS1894184_09960 [Clostridia bacterium]